MTLRDHEGRLHALRNVCCHRGAEVVLAADGNRRTLQCHYHAWTYGLDGRLLTAPTIGADRRCCGRERIRARVVGSGACYAS